LLSHSTTDENENQSRKDHSRKAFIGPHIVIPGEAQEGVSQLLMRPQ
jgi:hypothetical protein